MDRSTVTFVQAEGLQDLPKQLKLKHLDNKSKALIWACVFRSFMESVSHTTHGPYFNSGPWVRMLEDYWVEVVEGDLDKRPSDVSKWVDRLSVTFRHKDYFIVLGSGLIKATILQ